MIWGEDFGRMFAGCEIRGQDFYDSGESLASWEIWGRDMHDSGWILMILNDALKEIYANILMCQRNSMSNLQRVIELMEKFEVRIRKYWSLLLNCLSIREVFPCPFLVRSLVVVFSDLKNWGTRGGEGPPPV